MLARVRSGALSGISAVLVDVEVDMALGLPYFNVVGLPDGAAKESKVRVISALKNAGFELPQKRITVNLAPADIRKEGAAFELPLALGILASCGQLAQDALDATFFAGELSLDGNLKPIRGVLPLTVAARDLGFRSIMIPISNAAEASIVKGIAVIAVSTLREAHEHLTGDKPLAAFNRGAGASPPDERELDISEVRGQPDLKKAMEIAAAGGHNLLMRGPPGSGKTMMARRLPGILPKMEFEEALEVTKIYSVLGLLRDGHALVEQRPFRSPHHTISDAGLVGGGPFCRPGELSMAHQGVLFLDELPEFRKNVLEVLRQPLEENLIHLARANVNVTYPCQVMLIAAMNPCPCGYFNVPHRTCKCLEAKRIEYQNRVSGPLLDRIDLLVETRPVEFQQLVGPSTEKPSSYYRDRVQAARERQRHRFRDVPKIHCNSQLTPRLLAEHCRLSSRPQNYLSQAVRSFAMSARSHDRVLKIARTLADLEGHAEIEASDMAMAISLRVLDRRAAADSEGRRPPPQPSPRPPEEPPPAPPVVASKPAA